MAGLGTFLLQVGVDTAALQRGLNNAESSIDKFGKKAENTFGKLSVLVSAPLALIAKKAITAFGEMEALELSLGTLEKTSTSLAARLKELNEVAKLPGIGFKEAIQADVRLRAVGISADISKRAMLSFGNAIATAGGGKAQFDAVIYQLAQMSAKSKVLSQDFRPIIEAVPMVATAVKKLYGTVDTEQIQSKMSKAGINSAQFINQLITELEKLPKVSGGVKNAIENLEDTFFKTFASIGQTIDKNVGIKDWVEKISNAATGLAESFATLSPEAQKAILAISGIAIVVPPLLATIGMVAPAIMAGIGALASPIGLAVVAVGALVAVWADYEITANRIASASKTLAQVEGEVKTSIHEQGLEVSLLNDILQSHTTTLEEKKKALDKLQSISPQYFGNLKAENLNYSDLNVSLSKYITNLEKSAKAKALVAQIEESVATEQAFIKKPEKATDWVGQGAAWLNEKAGGSSYDAIIEYNKKQAIKKIQDSRKPIEEELKVLLKEGYIPTPDKPKDKPAGGGGTPDDEAIKKAKKLAEDIKKVREDLISDTAKSEIETIVDSFSKQRAETNKAYLDDIKAKKDVIQGKKGLDDEYANWFVARYEEMQAKLRGIQVSEFKTPELIKQTLVTDTQKSLSSQLDNSGKVKASKISLNQTFAQGINKLDTKGEYQRLENYLKLAEGSINSINFSGYAQQAQIMLDSNQLVKDSFSQMALSSGQVIGEMIINMATGTATIADLAKSMLATVGNIFADLLQQLAVAQLKISIVKGIVDPTALFKGIGLAVAAGAVGAFSKKINQGNASNTNQQKQGASVYNTVLRGSDILASQQRYQTIKGF